MLVSEKILKSIAYCVLVGVLVVMTNGLYGQPTSKRYAVKEGGHFSTPRVYKLKRDPSVIRWDVVFEENCDYIIREEDGSVSRDQLDWNKLCGVFFKVLSFNTRKESVMIGWRYNIERDEIELSPYYHIRSGRDMFPPMMTVKREEPFSVVLEIDREVPQYRWTMEKKGFSTQHEMAVDHTSKTCGFINFYFGGNRSAPKAVSSRIAITVQ